MGFDVVNLNDAIYRIINRTQLGDYNYLAGVTAVDFNQVNCPLLWERDFKELVTWMDFIKILGGDPTQRNWNRGDSTAPGKGSCCRAIYYPDYHYLTTHKWGQTFGIPKGPKGRPLAESKMLDEAFFYYAKLYRNFRGTAGNVWNDAIVISMECYAENSWDRVCQYDTKHDNRISYGSRAVNGVLHPGVYCACVTEHWGYSGYSECGMSFDGIQTIAVLEEQANIWSATNVIFFVDSTIPFQCYRTATTAWGHSRWGIYRITPPGYWE